MTRIRSLLVALFLGTALAGIACSDGPVGPITVTNPEPDPDPDSPQDSVPTDPDDPQPSGDQAQVLERNESLEEDEVVTKTISALLGGFIELPEAGLRVVIPPLALPANTEITVTAPAGDLVGYHFEPSGLEFNLPILVTQDLSTTLAAGLGGLSAVYFEGDLESTVTIVEVLPLSVLNLLGIFEVSHFSGYVIATN